MLISEFTSDQARWQAVLARDVAADDAFVFAVVTTGIFCRPSCHARRPLRENIRFYPHAAAAQAAGFRPCKRCQPDKIPPAQQRAARVAVACRLMAESATPLTLAQLAEAAAMSPWHFHRLFKSVTGLTPHGWQQALRAQKLRSALGKGQPVTGALYQAGYGSGSAFYRDADQALGMPARRYRRGGEQEAIRYGVARCQSGYCLVAASDRGICAILLGDSVAGLEAELSTLFAQARTAQQDVSFQRLLQQTVSAIEAPERPFTLPLDMRGTAFQLQVWQALRAIPAGSTLSYQQLAERIGRPRAVRAVASACAANKLAVAVPCHRILRQDGALSGYRWGRARKAQLLKHEAENLAGEE